MVLNKPIMTSLAEMLGHFIQLLYGNQRTLEIESVNAHGDNHIQNARTPCLGTQNWDMA